MKHYTQDDIVAWQVKTFGPIKDDLTCLIRANMEMAEMLTHLNRGEHEEAAIEAADVMIVLAGYGKSKGRDLLRCDLTFDELHGYGETSAVNDASLAHYYLAMLIETAVYSQKENYPKELCGMWKFWAGMCVTQLRAVAFKLGHLLSDLVDRKMAINEAREWACNGDGTGSHVKGVK